MEDINIYSVEDAEAAGLMQLKIWVDKVDFPWLLSEYNRIIKDKSRKAMIVQNYSRFTLFVNELVNISNLINKEEL